MNWRSNVPSLKALSETEFNTAVAEIYNALSSGIAVDLLVQNLGKELSSEDIVINVLEGPAYADADNNLPTNASGKQPVVLNENQFAFIKTKANFSSIKEEDFFNLWE